MTTTTTTAAAAAAAAAVATVAGRRRPRSTATHSSGVGGTSAVAFGGGEVADRIDSLRKGRRISVLSASDRRHDLSVVRKIGEGGSSFVYLVKANAGPAAAAVTKPSVGDSGADDGRNLKPAQAGGSRSALTVVASDDDDDDSDSDCGVSSPVATASAKAAGEEPRAGGLAAMAMAVSRSFTRKSHGLGLGKPHSVHKLLATPPGFRGLSGSGLGQTATAEHCSLRRHGRGRSRGRGRGQSRLVVLKATNIRAPDNNVADSRLDDQDEGDGKNLDDEICLRRLRSAETEVSMLRRFSSHPNILGFVDAGWWPSSGARSGSTLRGKNNGTDEADGDDVVVVGNASEHDGEGNEEQSFASFGLQRRGGVHCILLEYCPGGSLMDLISRQRDIMLLSRKVGNLCDYLGGSKRRPLASDDVDISSTLRKLDCRSSRKSIAAATKAASAPTIGGGANCRARRRKDAEHSAHNHHVRHTDRDSATIVSSPSSLAADANGYLPLPVVVDILRQVSDALVFLHGHFEDGPVIHRDIKPENVLLVPRSSPPARMSSFSFVVGVDTWYDVRLADFGSAVIGRTSLRSPTERSLARDKVLRGTTQMYRAPEMVDLHMAEELTERTDVWALGCTLYQTLYLRNCFEENSNLAILSGRYVIPPNNPYGDSDAEELLSRMMEMDPKIRIGATDVRDCSDALAEGKSLPLPPRRRRRRPSSDVKVRSDDEVMLKVCLSASDKDRATEAVEGRTSAVVEAPVLLDRVSVTNDEVSKQPSGEHSSEAGSKRSSVAERRRKRKEEQADIISWESTTFVAPGNFGATTRSFASPSTGTSSFQVDDIYRDLMTSYIREEEGKSDEGGQSSSIPSTLNTDWYEPPSFPSAAFSWRPLDDADSADATGVDSTDALSRIWSSSLDEAGESVFRVLSPDASVGDGGGGVEGEEDDDKGDHDDDEKSLERGGEGWIQLQDSLEEDMTDDILRSIRIFPSSPFSEFSSIRKGISRSSRSVTDGVDVSCPGGIEISLAGTSSSSSSSSSTSSLSSLPKTRSWGNDYVDVGDDYDEGGFTVLLDGEVREDKRCGNDNGVAEYLRRVCPSVFAMGET